MPILLGLFIVGAVSDAYRIYGIVFVVVLASVVVHGSLGPDHGPLAGARAHRGT